MGDVVVRRGDDLTAVLELGKHSPEELDGILRQEPGTVRKWRDGGVRIPKEEAEALTQIRMGLEYDAKVEALALPKCPTNEVLWAAVEAYPIEDAGSGPAARAFKAQQAHLRECPLCRSNEERKRREVGPNAWMGDRSLDLRVMLAMIEWSSRPWTLVLSLPALAASTYALFTVQGEDATLWRAAYGFLGGFFIKLAYPALHTIWRRLRDPH